MRLFPLSLSSSKACIKEVSAGFSFIPSALSIEQQRQLAQDCLLNFPQPPSHTNHTKAHGDITDLWQAARAGEEKLKYQLRSNHASECKLSGCLSFNTAY